MSDCIFCKIIAGQIPSAKIRENDEFLAILDAFPACQGQTLLMPKAHVGSDVFLMPDEQYTRFLLAAKEVIALMKKGLKIERIGMVVEGLEVNHAHIKLYPFRGGRSFQGGLAGASMAKLEELEALAAQIRKA